MNLISKQSLYLYLRSSFCDEYNHNDIIITLREFLQYVVILITFIFAEPHIKLYKFIIPYVRITFLKQMRITAHINTKNRTINEYSNYFSKDYDEKKKHKKIITKYGGKI